MESSEIRNGFLDFFKNRGHVIVPSDSLIPSADPTLLFTSAGMVQFKKHFLGQSKDTFTRAVSSQKCFRTSDIENVGFTNRHLTFFEMLGNFSFGDYFKQEAIHWGWEFLTTTMSLPKDKLYATVYKDDDEAYEIWKTIIPEPRILRMGNETNFWTMGPTGPCGPCSEIFMDLGEELSCGKPACSPECDCDRYMEVWNLVFTQFDKQEGGSLKKLPRKNIDTGMGFERLVSVVNGKKSIFDTDLFIPLIERITAITGLDPKKDVSTLRMMADHVRGVTFLISDGILPSNEGRGYVLRRILRRAVRQGKMAGISEPFIYKITSQAVEAMKDAYPELDSRRENISSITKMEEEKFLETLESGMKILNDVMDKSRGLKIIPGTEVFKLYDTYGFPHDLTKDIARENGLAVDEEGFIKAQKFAQEKSRSAWSGSGQKDSTFYSSVLKKTGETIFKGYDELSAKTNISAIIKDGKETDTLMSGSEGELILKDSPFYAESGGQVGDTGLIFTENAKADVIDTLKPVDGLYVHKVKVTKGTFNNGDAVSTFVDKEHRDNISKHHTTTHLLHKALRNILGTHVTQAGSLVTPDYFRFDFTHFSGLKQKELESVEGIVNEAIRADMPVCIDIMNVKDAQKSGAMALFGEKYSDTVRVISIKSEKDCFSKELCGGTHVSQTGKIGFFKIISESSVAAGTRRIEAIVGKSAENYVRNMGHDLDSLSNMLKSSKQEIISKTEKLILREKELEKEIKALKERLATGSGSDISVKVKEIDGVKVLAEKLSDLDMKSLRGISDSLKKKIGSGIVIIASVEDSKGSFVVSLTKDALDMGYSASNIAKNFAQAINGSGGGKADFAQGGTKDIALIDGALNNLSEIIKK